MKLSRGMRRAATALLLTGTLAALSACATAGPSGAVFVRVGPPRPVAERRLVAPGPGYVWLPGFYAWSGNAYVWTAGRWERPPRARAVWVRPHWEHERRGWFFVEGHWR